MPLPKPIMTAEDYWTLPEGERAELIDGELWDLAAPNRLHQEIVTEMAHQMRAHVEEHHGGCKVYAAPFAVNLFADDSTFVEPDVSVVCDPDKLSDRGCEGAPDMVVEIVSPSSRAMDYSTKLHLYSEASVREYWIVDPSMKRTTAYRFAEDPAPLVYPFTVPIPSHVLAGLEIDFNAIADGA